MISVVITERLKQQLNQQHTVTYFLESVDL